MNIQTTLSFYGRTEEAVAFYGRALNAETLFLMRFRDCPDPTLRKLGLDEKIFHATLRIGSTVIMASDCGCEQPSAKSAFAGFSLALRVEKPADAEQYFAALGDGGQIGVPMAKTFYAERYGIVTDRFGVSWKVMVESNPQN